MILFVLRDMPCHVHSFVSECEDSYTVVLNSRLSNEQQREAAAHELSHLRNNDLQSSCNADSLETVRHGAKFF